MAQVPVAGGFAPELELPDSTGLSRQLSDWTSQGSLVLLFYRGNW